MALDPADVLALLEEHPYDQVELAGVLGVPITVVRRTLKALKRGGQVKRVGGEKKWALASYVAPVGRPRSSSSPVKLTKSSHLNNAADDDLALEDDDVAGDVDDTDADVEQLEAEPPASNVGSLKSEVRSTNARGKALRQPVDSTIKKDAPPAWWVDAKPDGFTDQARTHQARMRASKESKFVPFRMLQ